MFLIFNCSVRVNFLFIEGLCSVLGIEASFSWSHDYEVPEGKTARLAHMTKQLGGTHYLSGPAAKSYIENEVFSELDITLGYFDYSGYPEYQQLHGEFEHAVSVLDLLFQSGEQVQEFMKSDCWAVAE